MSVPVVGDPHHEVREDLKARGWLEVFYNEDAGHLRERDWANHPNGYFQPAVIAIHNSGQVLYRWRCVPKFSNMSGAGGRPEARYTWDQLQDALSSSAGSSEQEPSRQDAELDQEPVMGAGDLSWFKFLVILTAHGWFLRPRQGLSIASRREQSLGDAIPGNASGLSVFRRLGIGAGISADYLGCRLGTGVCGCINAGSH
jgi:hypothetical protein